MRYKILCKMKGEKESLRLDYIFGSSGELIRYLDHKEGINTVNTDYIYIHEHRPDGTVVETYAYERDKEVKCDVIEGKCEVIQEVMYATAKVANGMYKMMEAG